MSAATQPAPVPSSAPHTEWWRGAVVYHVYPLSFADANGDGAGDLAGVTSRLEHIASLGVDMVWLSPFFRSPMRDFGYDVSDYEDVDPLFGTLADFEALIAKAHHLGLKVVIDLVFAHTSDEHAWFKQSRQGGDNPYADWYVWADPKPDGSPPNNWQAVFGGPCWTWDARRRQYYLHNFLPTQPNLNAHNPAVQDALLDVMRFWLDKGVDGFRLDAVNFMMHDPALTDNPTVLNPVKTTRPFDFQHHFFNQSHPAIPAFLTRLRALADSYGERFLVAEVGGERADEEMLLYTHGPDRLHSAYSFHYLYADELTPQLICEGLAQWPQDDEGVGWPSWAFSNHDAPRCVSRWAQGRDRDALARMTLLLLISLRGNAFVFQGEELGLPQGVVPYERLRDPEAIMNWPLTLGRDGARTPMPWRSEAENAGFGPGRTWLPLDPHHAPLAVDQQERNPQSTLHVARRIIRLRKELPALRTETMRVIKADESLLVFERGEGPSTILCAFNLGHEPISWRLPPGWRVAEAINDPDLAHGVLPPMAAVLAVR
jgi:alpha-glucosidase